MSSTVQAQPLTQETLLVQSNHQLLQDVAEIRPANTKASYEPKQAEFKAWCDQKNFAEVSRYTVTEDKLVGFLNDCVIGRQLKRKRNAIQPVDALRTVSSSTVKSYIASIVDLYNY